MNSVVEVLKKGDGAQIIHGSRVKIAWRLSNFITHEVLKASPNGGEDEVIEVIDPKSWVYRTIGHRSGSLLKISAELDGTFNKYTSIKEAPAGYSVIILDVNNSRVAEHREKSAIYWEEGEEAGEELAKVVQS